MTSQINPDWPVAVNPTTESVRQNFATAKTEIEALQSIVSSSATPLAFRLHNDETPITRNVNSNWEPLTFSTVGFSFGASLSNGIFTATEAGIYFFYGQAVPVGSTVCQYGIMVNGVVSGYSGDLGASTRYCSSSVLVYLDVGDTVQPCTWLADSSQGLTGTIPETYFFGYKVQSSSSTSDSGWVPLTLLNGWSPVAGYPVPAYRRIGDVVYFRGLITGGPSKNAITTLPAEITPIYRVIQATNSLSTSSTYFVVCSAVHPTFPNQLYLDTSAGEWTSLEFNYAIG